MDTIPPVPIAPEVLTSNSSFALIHKHLITNVFDSDASTRKTNATHVEIAEKLHRQRIRHTKDAILMSTLRSLAHSDKTLAGDRETYLDENDPLLPRQLRDLVLIIASYIKESPHLSLTSEDNELLSDEINAFRSQISEISSAISQKLHRQHTELSSLAARALEALYPEASNAPTTRLPKMQSTTVSASSRHPALSTSISNLQTQLSQQQTTNLPRTLSHLSNTVTTHLALQTTQLTHLIRSLELHQHGALTRHLHSRAQFLSSVAAGLEGKSHVLKLEARAKVYGPGSGIREALEMRVDEVQRDRQAVETRVETLQAALAEYVDADGAAGEALRRLGARYTEIESEIAQVKADLQRLKGRTGKV